MQLTEETSRGDWIREQLGAFGTVGGTVPRRFEAVARIFHPALLHGGLSEEQHGGEQIWITWADVAQRLGRTAHPAMQWSALVGDFGSVDLDDGWTLHAPSEGSLGLDELATIARVLARHTAEPALTTAAIWNGFAELHPGSGLSVLSLSVAGAEPGDDERATADAVAHVEQELADSVSAEVTRAATSGPWLELPDRSYLLFDCGVREFADPAWAPAAKIGWHGGSGPTPNLLWPADRSWCLTTEIDFDSTLVAGSRALIDELLAADRLEALEVDNWTGLRWHDDTVNRTP